MCLKKYLDLCVFAVLTKSRCQRVCTCHRQCSRCVKIDNDANGSDGEVNPNAPMRLREKIKEPAKFTPSGVREKRKVGNTRLHETVMP